MNLQETILNIAVLVAVIVACLVLYVWFCKEKKRKLAVLVAGIVLVIAWVFYMIAVYAAGTRDFIALHIAFCLLAPFYFYIGMMNYAGSRKTPQTSKAAMANTATAQDYVKSNSQNNKQSYNVANAGSLAVPIGSVMSFAPEKHLSAEQRAAAERKASLEKRAADQQAAAQRQAEQQAAAQRQAELKRRAEAEQAEAMRRKEAERRAQAEREAIRLATENTEREAIRLATELAERETAYQAAEAAALERAAAAKAAMQSAEAEMYAAEQALQERAAREHEEEVQIANELAAAARAEQERIAAEREAARLAAQIAEHEAARQAAEAAALERAAAAKAAMQMAEAELAAAQAAVQKAEAERAAAERDALERVLEDLIAASPTVPTVEEELAKMSDVMLTGSQTYITDDAHIDAHIYETGNEPQTTSMFVSENAEITKAVNVTESTKAEVPAEPMPEMTLAPSVANKKADFDTCYAKAKAVGDKGRWDLAAGLFEQSAKLANTTEMSEKALLAAMSSYVKANKESDYKRVAKSLSKLLRSAATATNDGRTEQMEAAA
ncbi:MAG: hypothetical protein LBG97_02580 [Coriobacteriales bacterium]|jgi:hypothetical protein|nr:hypothetical protein [Coriobacteriales bacterium]